MEDVNVKNLEADYQPLASYDGANSYGQLGTGNCEDKHQPERSEVGHVGDVQQITGGGGHTALITGRGECLLCGNNNKGQLGLMSKSHSITLQKLSLPFVITKVACGWEHTLSLTDAGKVLAWGSNSHGQAGNTHDLSIPAKLEAFSGHQMTDIAAGLRHSLALSSDGSVWSWGCGKKGQLGWLEDLKNKMIWTHQPKKVPAKFKGKSLTAGSLHSIVITDESRLFCWGDNKRGQLGIMPDNSNPETLVIFNPREISLGGLRISQVASGWTHVLILSDAGDVYSWGRNNYGQLGRSLGSCQDDNIRKISWKPAKIKSLPVVKQISCGSEHNIVLTESGKVLSWGWNEHGTCGDGTEVDVTEPKEVTALDKKDIYKIGSGAGHSMVALR